MAQPGKDPTLSARWAQLKAAAAETGSSAARLASIRWEMAKLEASAWGRSLLLRAAALAAACLLVLLALGLLTAGLVQLVFHWTGSVAGAIFIVFGVYVVGAAVLFALAFRAGRRRAVFERTLEELGRDVEGLTGRPE